MHITFIENSFNFTASSLNIKAIDSVQKNLIYFTKELSKIGHKISVFNQTDKDIIEDGVSWRNINSIKKLRTDVLIVCDDINYISVDSSANIKIFWLNYQVDNNIEKKMLINLIKNKFMILYSSQSLVSRLEKNFNYVPKVFIGNGVAEEFFNPNNSNIRNSCALVTTHPLRGLEWLIEVWVKIISLKLPWAEMHVFSRSLSSEKYSKNIKINNLKLKLKKYKNSGIIIKKPLPQSEFINTLSNYRVHLDPCNSDNFTSLSLLESQAAGIPVVSRSNNNIFNTIYNNETGYVADNEYTFAQKTINLLNDNALFLRISSNSKLNNYVKKWSEIARNFERIVNENSIYR